MNCTIWSNDENVTQELKKQVDQWSIFLKCNVVDHNSSIVQIENSDAHLIHLDEYDQRQLDAITRLNHSQSFVVFLVPSQSRFIKVIKTSALDYLVWPTNLSAFHEFECRLKDLHSMSSESEEFYTSYKEALRFFSTNLHRLTRKELILPGVRRYVVSRREEIVRIESEGSYSWVFFANSASMLMNKPLQHFDCVLDESNFIRIGQEHLINLNYLKSCQRNEGVSVTLQDGKTIEVSIRRVPLFMEAFSTWSKRRKHNPGLP